MGITPLEKDFSHSLEMTKQNSESVISNDVKDLSELNHDPSPKLNFLRSISKAQADPALASGSSIPRVRPAT
jgi:hypothetical protein